MSRYNEDIYFNDLLEWSYFNFNYRHVFYENYCNNHFYYEFFLRNHEIIILLHIKNNDLALSVIV